MLRRALVAASLVCSVPFCAALQPAGAEPCSPANAAGRSAAGIAQVAGAAQEPGTPNLIQNPAAPAANCPASDPKRSDNSTANSPVYELRMATGTLPDLPDAPLAAKKSALHGEAFGLRGSTLIGAPDVTLRDEIPVTEWGGSVGGDLQRISTGYFVSFDQFGFSQPKLLSFLAEMQAHGQSLSLDGSPIAFTTLAAGADRRFGQRDSAWLRFNRDDLSSYSLRPNAAANAPGLASNFGMKQQTIAAGNAVSISPGTLNQTSIQLTSSDVRLPAGAADMGVQSGLPTLHRDRVFEAADNIYKQMAGQNLRMGGDFVYNSMNISFIESGLGRNSFFSQSDRGAGLYVNSEKKLRSNLVFTSGIRYNILSLRGFRADPNNVAPQVGFAWAPSSRTVIRGGVGMYYDQVALPAIAGSSSSDGVANIQNSGRFVSRNGLPASAMAAFTVSSPSMQNSYAEQADFEVEQQIGVKSTISAETQFIRGVQLALPVYRSAALCESARACQAGNAFWGQEMGTGAVSTYSGTSVAFAQQPVRWGNYKVSYTYATAQSTGTAENTAMIEDRMRRASFTGVLHTSLDPGTDAWQRLTHGFMLTGTSDYADRSEFAGMSFLNFNARLSKTLAWGQGYRLQLQTETFNMLQRTNAAFARSMALRGDGTAIIYNTYQRVASFQSPNGTLVGLHLDF